jgi:hypothetical protein
MLQVKAPGEHAFQPNMAHTKFAYPSLYAVDPSGIRNTNFSGTTTVDDSTVSYERGRVGSNPRPGDPPGFPNMSFNITTVDDISGSYESRATGFHPANAKTTDMMPSMRAISPRGNPPSELAGTPADASKDGG